MARSASPGVLDALLALVGWMAVTLLVGRLVMQEVRTLPEAVAGGFGGQFVAAALFLLGLAALRGWHGLGLGLPEPRTLRLAWVPAIYVAVMAAGLAAIGLPPAPVLLIVAVNMALVGFSEELMFRGVLWSGLRSRLAFWPAVVATSLVFGAVHVLNVFATGDLGLATLQAAAAACSGVLFLALRVRSGSIWPSVAVHAVWNFMLVTLALSVMEEFGAPTGDAMEVGFAPLLLVAPLLLHGLWLLRNRAPGSG